VPRVAFPESPEWAASERALDARIDVDLDDVPLAEAVATVAAIEPRVNFVLRPGWNWAELARVTLKREATPRRAVLEAMLPPGELGCEIHDGYIVVSDKGAMASDLPLAAYPVADLVPQDFARPGLRGRSAGYEIEEEVMSGVTKKRFADVASWADEGGPARIECAGGVLLVTQTPAAHRRITALLQALRLRPRVRAESR
jgi:hypothetical protein